MLRTRRFLEREHTDEEIKAWIDAYVKGDLVEDYHMAAWLMAVCFNPLSARETATLTRSLVETGVRVDWGSTTGLVDKHSTGGVGDKVSLVLAPLANCLGVKVPMMAGRGLGHTGGTIDKLESIPGFRCDWSVAEFQHIVNQVGCSIVAAGPELCPGDQKLYALRDVTGTVSSVPLQTASIMSKKIAENPNSLVLDSKCGLGAFQTTPEHALELAQSMVATGEANGLCPTTAFLTNMDQPLGFTIGNWVEVQECIDIMKGSTEADDLVTLIVLQAAQMVFQTLKTGSLEDWMTKARAMLASGVVLDKFREMVIAQGGDASVLEGFTMPGTPHVVKATRSGFIQEMNARRVGEITVDLGAGRKVVRAPVDPYAGIILTKKVGAEVEEGEVLAKLYGEHVEEAARQLQEVIVIGGTAPVVPPIVSHIIDKNGVREYSL